MPEGPELHLSSRFVKKVGDTRQFVGKIVERLPSNRSPRLDDLNSRLGVTGLYSVTSWSRGKELMLAIKPQDLPDDEKYRPEEWSIRFNFGMTGCFKFTRTSELPKHAKVCFTAVGKPSCTLSFVDMRGFGRWTPTSEWSENRGPCIIQERDLFRAHVLSSLDASAFNKPICEVMLDQRYFNGVGNYLRAEALHRLGLAPFTCARDMLSPLPAELKPGGTDVLQLCHLLAAEVVSLGGGKRYDVPLDVLEELTQEGLKQEPAIQNEENDEGEVDAFEEWLQCYYQPGMKNLVDHQGRTVWFAGSPGPMVPTARKQRHGAASGKVTPSSKSGNSAKQDDSDEDYAPAEKRAKRASGRRVKSARGSQKCEEVAKVGARSKRSSSKKAKSENDSVRSNGKARSVRNGELKTEKSYVSKSVQKRNGQTAAPRSVTSGKRSQSKAGERRSRRLSGKPSETS